MTTPAQREQRRLLVSDLAISGLTERQIVDALRDRFGVAVSKTTVHRDLIAIRAEWTNRHSASYDSWVAEMIATLDAARRRVLPQVHRGNLLAVDRLLAIVDRYCRILGLNAPKQVAISEADLDRELERLRDQMDDQEFKQILRESGLDDEDD